MKFAIGDRVRKMSGSYSAVGTVVAAFRTVMGQERYVFEFDVPSGLLHIFTPGQLEPMEVKP